MKTFRRLILGLTMALVASFGLTVGTTTAAHADTVVYQNGPDQYGTYNDIRYATKFPQGVFGQVTYSHNISLQGKAKFKQWGSNAEAAAAVAGWICGKLPHPAAQGGCVYLFTKNYADFKAAFLAPTENNDRCIASRWYAAGWASAVYSATEAVRCWTGVDYCPSCGYEGGGGGGGGGGGSWRNEAKFALAG